MKESLTRKIFTSDNINWREERQSRDDEIERKETWWRRLRVRWIRETVLSALKTRTRSLQSPYSKRKKICCLWNEGIHFFSSKISKSIYILFLSCLFIIVDHNQPDQKQFQYSFCSQNWHQVFIWRNGWNWIDCPRTPSFFPKMVLNYSQWNLAHMELYLFSVSCKKRKMCFFFLNGLSFCIWLSPLDTFQ